ncbi:MAG: methyltransferase family protein [Candidatus Dormibacteria bacterium]
MESAALGTQRSPIFRRGPLRPVFWTLMATWVASEVTLQLRSRASAPAHAEDQLDHGSMAALIGSVWGAVGGGLAAAANGGRARPRSTRLAVAGGSALMAAGICLRWWAIIALGEFFTVRVAISPRQRLVQRGPYLWIQHPGYAGALLTVAGCLWCCDNRVALALSPLPVAAFARRVTIEERALAEQFGAEYRDYAAARKRLVPFIF